MKKIIGFLIVLGVIVGGYFIFKPANKPNVGGYFINTPTSATSTVGIYTQTSVMSADSARSFASFCNMTNAVPATNDAVFLQLGATTTGLTGLMIKPQECYEMTGEKGNLFTGIIYARASTSTTTLLMVSNSKSN